MNRLCYLVMLLSALGTSLLHAQPGGEDLIKLTAFMFDGLDQYVEAAEVTWEQDFDGRLKRRNGTPLSSEEIHLPLDRTRELLTRLRQEMKDANGGSGVWTPEQEELAIQVAELRWSLVLEEARLYVAILRDKENSNVSYDEVASRLNKRREELIWQVSRFIDSAKLEQRTLAWEAWADFADATLDVRDGNELASQLDDFLRSSRIVHVDSKTGEQSEFDMTPRFGPLAIEFPDEEDLPPVYPNVEGRPTSRAFALMGLKLQSTQNWQERRLLFEALGHTVRNPQQDMRVFAILGEGIVDWRKMPELEDDHPWMDYEVVSTYTENNPHDLRLGYDFVNGWFTRALDAEALDSYTQQSLERYDRVGVLATPRLGAMPGPYTFRLNGQELTWIYGRSSDSPAALGDLRIRRALPDGEFAPVSSLFDGDRFVIEIELDQEIDAEEIDVSLARWTEANDKIERLEIEGSSGVNMHRVKDPSIVYRSEVLRTPTTLQNVRRPDPGKTLDLPAGSQLLVSLPTSTPILFSPQVAPVFADPSHIKRSWGDALNQAIRTAGFETDQNVKATHLSTEISTGGWFSGSNVDISLGDHAALIILRDELQSQLEAHAAEMKDFFNEVMTDDDVALNWFKENLGNEIRSGGPLASLPVELDSTEADTLRKAMNDLLFKTKTLDEMEAVNVELARYVAEASKENIDAATERTQSIQRDDVRALLELIGGHPEPLRKNVIPDLLRHEKIGGDLWWIPERVGAVHMGTIEQKYKELKDADEVEDAEMDVIVAVASLAAVGAQGYAIRKAFYGAHRLATGLRGAALVLEGFGLGDSLTRKLPQYYSQRAEVQFARGTRGVFAHERFDEAVARQKPGWLLLAEITAGGIGMGTEAVAFAQAYRLSRLNVRNIETGGEALGAIAARVNSANKPPRPPPPGGPVSPSPASMNELLNVVEEGGLDGFRSLPRSDHDRLLAVFGIFGKESEKYAELISPAIAARARAIGQALGDEAELRMAEKYWEASWFREVATELPDGKRITLERPDWIPDESGGGISIRYQAMGENAPKGFQIGERLGEGASAVVHSIPDDPTAVAKLMKLDPDQAEEDLEFAMEAARKLAAADIPHLPILGHGRNGDLVYAVQRRLPEGARTIRYRSVKAADGIGVAQRGVRTFDPDKPLPRAYQRAVLRLLKKLGAAGLVWEDAHLENLYFFRNGLKWEAGLLDLDRIVSFGASRYDMDLAFGQAVFKASFGGGGFKSLIGAPKNAGGLWDPLIDADFAMQKMLERKHYIDFNSKEKQWRGVLMDLEIVEQYYPGFRTHLGPDLARISAGRAGR